VLAHTQAAANRGELDDGDLKWIVSAARQIADDILDLPERDEPRAENDRIRVVTIPAEGECDQLTLELLTRLMASMLICGRTEP